MHYISNQPVHKDHLSYKTEAPLKGHSRQVYNMLQFVTSTPECHVFAVGQKPKRNSSK